MIWQGAEAAAATWQRDFWWRKPKTCLELQLPLPLPLSAALQLQERLRKQPTGADNAFINHSVILSMATRGLRSHKLASTREKHCATAPAPRKLKRGQKDWRHGVGEKWDRNNGAVVKGFTPRPLSDLVNFGVSEGML